MDVKRSELLNALKLCLPGIESGTAVLEGADLFIFMNGNVHSYNDIISVTVPIKSEGLLDEGIEGAVRAEEFYSIINKLPGDVIQFKAEAEKWILKSGKAKVEMTLMAGDFTDRFKGIAPEKKKWLSIPTEFSQGIGICRMQANKSQISGLYVTGEDMMSSDGYQINHFKYKGPDIEPFWIADPSAGELLKLGVLNEMQLKGSWAHFRTPDGVIFSVKTLQAEKWPYDKLMAVLEDHKQTKTDINAVFPKELFDAIDRATSFYLEIGENRAVRLILSPKSILVSAERASGSYEESVAWKDKITVGFDPIELYVDSSMILHAARLSLAFYLHQGASRSMDGARLIFTTQSSMHLMSTLSKGDIKVQTEKPANKKDKKKTPASMYEEPEEEEEEETPVKDKKKSKKEEPEKSTKGKKKPVKPVDDEEEDDEDIDPIPSKNKKGKKHPVEEDDDDEDDEDLEDDDEEDDSDLDDEDD